jgi:acetyl esterase/lipase
MRLAIALCLFTLCGFAHAQSETWQPSAGHEQVPIWPGTPPDSKPLPGPESVKTSKDTIGGKTVVAIRNVSTPTMTLYRPPAGKENGAAVVVFPGGGFEILAMDLEGTDVCDWITQRGVACVLLKYRVPGEPYRWKCNCRPHNTALSMPSLQDAQRTIRLVRAHAAEWHIDPHKIGVIGFSAGGYLVAEVSTNFNRKTYTPVDDADRRSSRPDFAMPIYPGHLAMPNHTLNPNIAVTPETPPTFIVQAEDDDVDPVEDSLVYYTALKNTKVPTEIHLYAKGGHAFGLRPTAVPITRWTALAEAWLANIGMIPAN